MRSIIDEVAQKSHKKRKRDVVVAKLFLIAFETFKIVCDKTFGRNFEDGSFEAIESFREAYCALNISVTTKVHLVFDHVFPECLKHGRGLGVTSEHTFESLHRDFLKHLERHLVKDKKNPNYGKKLKKTVCEYNSGHL